LFGPEDFGLPNTALDHCHAIITIPTAIGDASLNLAQAALVVAYELFLATSSSGPVQPEPPPAGTLSRAALDGDLAPAAELDALFEACRRTLVELYEPHIPGRTKVTIARMRALLLRAAPRSDEARLLTTMFEHIVRKISRSTH
jgi:tRNA C32,U32 (ribose-2'-O)-methylase TrmJ